MSKVDTGSKGKRTGGAGVPVSMDDGTAIAVALAIVFPQPEWPKAARRGEVCLQVIPRARVVGTERGGQECGGILPCRIKLVTLRAEHYQ